MKIVKAVIIIMLLGCLGFVLYRALGNNSQTQNSDIVSAGYRNIESRLRISGIILPHKEIEIKSTISGVLEKLLIHIGDEVDLGQPIARVQYEKDPMEHKQLQSQLEVAKEKLDHAEAIFRRTEDLYRKGVITLEEYENEKSNLSILHSNYQSVLTEIGMLKGIYGEGSISNIITATNSGTILELPIKEGGSVMARGTLSEGTTIAKIADLKLLIFRGIVLESDMVNLHVGMPATFTLMAAKGINLYGTLNMIAPKGTIQEGVSRFEVTANIEIPDSCRSYIKAGCTVNAEIVIDRKKHVLALEEKYFQFSYDSVYVEIQKENGDYEKRFLKTGISDGTYTEIVSGLDSLDRIKVTENK